MFDVVPYRILVRRVRDGDCDKIGELYTVVEPELTEFCLLLTADAASARRAADRAFVFAAERLAAQTVTVAGFRSALLTEAKGNCYSEIGRAALSDVTGDVAGDPAPMEIDRLQARLEHLRPEALSSPNARLTWRSRLAPSTAITVVLVMVVMIEMAALGLDLMPRDPVKDDPGRAVPAKVELLGSSQSSAVQSPQSQSKDVDSADRQDRAKSIKSPPERSPADSKSGTEPSTPRAGSNEQSASLLGDDSLPQVPKVDSLPPVPTPEVQIDVGAGPVDAQVATPGKSEILPSTSACVGSTCVSLP